ncbi:hypothetical protein AAZX31_13G065700 [Glycine max]
MTICCSPSKLVLLHCAEDCDISPFGCSSATYLGTFRVPMSVSRTCG